MFSFNKIVFICLIFVASPAHSGEWRALIERAGFMGFLAAGVSYEWTQEHATDVSLGGYHIDNETYYQTNIGYRYSRWVTPLKGNEWRPLQFGGFAVYALNTDRYFLSSPDKYPSKGYYDETALRYGAEFGSTLTFFPSRLAIGYRVRIFDNGLIAMFNNSNRDIQYYISSGFTLQYLF
ncbi:hypothetical protein [Bdellovibrio sp. HCB288]|uniref:hypothetical protein n=1 Tax=Bdellovibrio sp. HCB288 TaxID=3394355 RepID=UPI0039B396F1